MPDWHDDQLQWLTYGVERKFCTMPFCSTHNGWPREDDKLMELIYDGQDDRCLFVTRIREDLIEELTDD